jgi:hypothetical protein
MDVPFRIFEVREMTDAEKVEFKERMQMSLSVRLGLVAKALFRNGATIELTAVAHEKSPWAREDVWRVLVGKFHNRAKQELTKWDAEQREKAAKEAEHERRVQKRAAERARYAQRPPEVRALEVMNRRHERLEDRECRRLIKWIRGEGDAARPSQAEVTLAFHLNDTINELAENGYLPFGPMI